jgi:hypothetical protein
MVVLNSNALWYVVIHVENSANLLLLLQDWLPLVTLSYFLLLMSVTFWAQCIFAYYTSADMKFIYNVKIPLRRPSPMGFLLLHCALLL